MNLLKRLLRRRCLHKFAWPRLYTDGLHYQTCLRCGTAYEYDWIEMRRTNRVKSVHNSLEMIVAHDSASSTKPSLGK